MGAANRPNTWNRHVFPDTLVIVSSREITLSVLREALANADVRLAILFGSQATGRARSDSDFDIGIVPFGEMSIASELALASQLSGLVSAEVDLVRLDRDNPLLGREVAQTGICLHEAIPGQFAAFRARAMSEWIDFDTTMAPHRAHKLKRWAQP
jgi:uncharacterized protein